MVLLEGDFNKQILITIVEQVLSSFDVFNVCVKGCVKC